MSGEPERLPPISEYARGERKTFDKVVQGVMSRDRGTSMNRWLVSE